MKRTTLKERNSTRKPFVKLLFPSNNIINFNKEYFISSNTESDFLEWVKKEAARESHKEFFVSKPTEFETIRIGTLKELDNEHKIWVITNDCSDSPYTTYKIPNLPRPKPRKRTVFEWIISKINWCFDLFERDELDGNESLKIEIEALKSKNAILMSKLNQLKQK